MKIDRHNYEEYFILYMDNELGSEDRRLVEAFVQQHPDLKDELDMLLQYKLAPDTTIVFEGKEELLKENGLPVITVNNYEEWLSLYIDNELTIEQQQLVDQFIAANPAAEKELAVLQKTKLQPEPVVFADKEALYRREEKVRRIIPFHWRAAAAILILALGISAVLVLNRKPSGNDPDIATAEPGRQTAPVENKTAVQSAENNSKAVVPEQKNALEADPFVAEIKNQPNALVKNNTDNKNLAIPNKKTVTPENIIAGTSPVIKKEVPVVADINNKPSNNLPQPMNNPNATANKTTDALAVNVPEINKLQNALTNPVVTSASPQPSDIVQASYKENGEMLEQSDGKKNKNRGIFRKIARTFEKRTSIDPTDDNKLLVAGLAIHLK